jgi:hypothetical protein
MAALEAFESGLDRRLFRDAHASDRSSGKSLWFSPAERRIVEALAARVLPSDSDGPGAQEAGVAAALDRIVAAASADRRAFYSRGLQDLDKTARRRFGRGFAELSEGEQTRFLEEIDRDAGRRFESPVARRLPRRLTILYYRWRYPAVDFFLAFIDDVFEVFYTSPTAWTWLGYDGPPMPLGYLDPTRPRI